MVETKQPQKISAIIQARMGSTRLPGKVLTHILQKPVIWHIIERLKFSKLINQIVLAIPNTPENDMLEQFAREHSIACYRGSEQEVLNRVYFAAKDQGSDVIVEIPADKPLIDPGIIDEAISAHVSSGADYTDTSYPARVLPLGLDVAVFNFNALEVAYQKAQDPYHRENVTSYFYENPNMFKLNSIKIPEHLKKPEMRLTLDTKEDLELITNIYENLYKEGKLFKTDEVLKLKKKKPNLKAINAHIIQKSRSI